MRRLPISRTFAAAMFCAAPFYAALPLAAHADDLPIRKAGLWEMKMSLAGGQLPAMTMQQCTDEASDKDMATTFGPMQKDMCPKNETKKTSDGYVIDAVCTTSGISMTSHSEITGDFNSGYTMKVTSKAEGSPKSVPRDTSMTIEAKWLGACKADQKPGDIMMPGGMKMNVKDMQAMKGMMKKQ